MNTFEASGEAALLAYTSQRQIAAALAVEVPHLARGFLSWLRHTLATARVE